jgi:hypothetical protein
MTTDQLASLPLKELRALAAGRGIARSSKLSKDELVLALQSALDSGRREPPAPTNPPAGSSAPPQPTQAWQPAPRDYGLAVPDAYGRDRLVLLVQDPSHIFAYWEVSPETLERVRAAAGPGAAAVLVLHTQAGSEQREVDLAGGNYYLAVAPGSSFTAELCLRDASGKLHRIAMSNRIGTPVAGPSWRTDEAWMEVDESFDDLLALAGMPGQNGSSGSMIGSSSQRFRNARQIRARQLGVEGETPAAGASIEAPAGAAGLPSSLALAQRGVESWSSAAISSAVLARAGAGVALGSGSGSGLGLGVGVSSAQLLSSGALSSRALSSRSLSSRSLSSGAVIEGAADAQYPIEGVFHAPPTGLPKAAEGIPSTPAQPNTHAGAPAAQATAPLPVGGPPVAPNAATPAPAHDPLAFIGAPKPASQRKPKPKRA